MKCKICGAECKVVDRLCEPCHNFDNHWTDMKLRYNRPVYIKFMAKQLKQLWEDRNEQ